VSKLVKKFTAIFETKDSLTCSQQLAIVTTDSDESIPNHPIRFLQDSLQYYSFFGVSPPNSSLFQYAFQMLRSSYTPCLGYFNKRSIWRENIKKAFIM
jgi:hypothetical protein